MNPAQAPLRISQVGLRGIVGPGGLSATHVVDFASAFGTFVEPGRPILIGRDPRASGIMLREGVLAGLLACGHRVIDLGVVSTPVIQHEIQRRDAGGGISIGASHNAAPWNALKFFGARGTYLSSAEANELLDIYHLRSFDYQEWSGVGTLGQDEEARDRYLDTLVQHFDVTAFKSLRVLVDCCNGTSAPLLRRLNERFGLDFILINDRPGANFFAHDPEISTRTLSAQLAPLMRPLSADAGFLFDIDSDRVGMATETGEAVPEERMLPLLADWLLPRGPGKIVLTNLSTTALVDEVARRHGGKVVRVPVGRQAAIDALSGFRPEQIAIAGEGTGAVMMPAFRFVYDGIAAMLAVLSILRERDGKLSRILAGEPRYSMLKSSVPLTTHRIPQLLMDLRDRYADGQANLLDGLRVDWPDKWFHVRVSQTEPIVRVITEQKGDPPRELHADLLEQVRSMS